MRRDLASARTVDQICATTIRRGGRAAVCRGRVDHAGRNRALDTYPRIPCCARPRDAWRRHRPRRADDAPRRATKDAPSSEFGDFYQRALTITSIAGHAGLPQISCRRSMWMDVPSACPWWRRRVMIARCWRREPGWAERLAKAGLMVYREPAADAARKQRTVSRRRPRRSAEQNRQQILRAATVEFATHGLAAGRISRIVKKSGSKSADDLREFGSKSALYVAALESALAELRAEELVLDVEHLDPLKAC